MAIFIVWIAFIFLQQQKTSITWKSKWKKVFCNIIMVSEDTTIVELNQCQKSDKAPFIIYADLDCIIEKVNVKVILKTHLHQN